MKYCRYMLNLAVVLALSVGTANARGGKSIIEFDDTRIIIELNATDMDSGIQMFVDGEGWKRLTVFDPHWKRVLHVKGSGSVGRTGLTELFFESAEPGFDDLPLDEFLDRFPEGTYWYFGRSVEGDFLLGTAELTHNLPAGPVLLLPEEDPPVATDSVVVDWDPVTTQFGGAPLEGDIVGYQVIVEQEEPLRVFSADVPADVTSISVPPEFLLPGEDYKFEVLAIEESGNQTLSEQEFSTAD